MDTAQAAWRTSGLATPTALLAYCASTDQHSRWYATASDTDTVCFFMSKRGKTYAAVKSKCKLQMSNGHGVWIVESGALQVISCTKPTTTAERFVIDTILPLFPTI